MYQAYREPSPPFLPSVHSPEHVDGEHCRNHLTPQKIADFLRKEPHALSWKVLPDYSTGPHRQLHLRMFTNYEKKALHSEPTIP